MVRENRYKKQKKKKNLPVREKRGKSTYRVCEWLAEK